MSQDFDFNAAETSVKEQARLENEEKLELAELLRAPLARKFVFQQWVDGYIFTTTFTGNSRGFKEEGKREQALQSFNAVLELNPDLFAQMYREYKESQNANQKN